MNLAPGITKDVFEFTDYPYSLRNELLAHISIKKDSLSLVWHWNSILCWCKSLEHLI